MPVKCDWLGNVFLPHLLHWGQGCLIPHHIIAITIITVIIDIIIVAILIR